MKARIDRTLGAGHRVQGFLDAEAAAIGDAVSPALRAKLDAAIAELETLQLEQGEAGRNAVGETSTQQALREQVYDQFIAPIAKVAEIALRDKPEYINLTAPAITKRKTLFVSRAKEVANAAEKYQAQMIEHGMATDFLAKFRAAIDQVASSRVSHGNLVTLRSKATAGLDAADKAVRDYIGLIDRQIKQTLKGHGDLAGAWATAKRIAQLPVTPQPVGDTTNGATTQDGGTTPPTGSGPTLVTEPPAKAA